MSKVKFNPNDIFAERYFSFKFNRQKLQPSSFVSEQICKICSSGTIFQRDVRNFPRAKIHFRKKMNIIRILFTMKCFSNTTFINEIYKFHYFSAEWIVCFQQILIFSSCCFIDNSDNNYKASFERFWFIHSSQIFFSCKLFVVVDAVGCKMKKISIGRYW